MPETYYYATGSEVTSIANAIRTKGGTNQSLEFPDEFVEAIEALEPQSDLTSITITPTDSVQHFYSGDVLLGKFYFSDYSVTFSNSDLTRMSEFQTGDTCYITGILYCRVSGQVESGSTKDISGTFIWQNGTNTYSKNGYTLTITTSNLSISQSSWSASDGIYASENSPDGNRIIGLHKVVESEHDGWNDITVNAAEIPASSLGDLIVTPTNKIQKFDSGLERMGRIYISESVNLPLSDISKLSEFQAGDICIIVGSVYCIGNNGTGQWNTDLAGSFIWQNGTNTYTKNGYTLTLTSSNASISHTSGYDISASDNPDGRRLLGIYRQRSEILLGTMLYGTNGIMKNLSRMSEFQSGDTCIVTGYLTMYNASTYQFENENDISGSFVWQDGTNTYTKNGYTLTITTSDVTMSSIYTGNVYIASKDTIDGYAGIGFRKKTTDIMAYSSVVVEPIPSDYIPASSVQHYYTGTSDPSSSLGANGDIYLKTS